jgi:ATP-dependent Clp protease ATP-binding subunit ClpC
LRRTIQRDIEDNLSERILFNELRPGHIIVVDCEGDPENIDESKLVFRSSEKPAEVPDAIPADIGTAASTEE